MSAVPAGSDPPADGDPAATTDSRQLTVPVPPPGTAHILIEYPGYVGDEQRVLETLGGAAGLASQLQVGAACAIEAACLLRTSAVNSEERM